MKIYYTGLLREYVQDWTPANAIREFAQNWLDSESPSEYEIGEDYIRFTSKGVKLPPKSLLMGASTKRKDPNSVGGKGEGYKNGCLILVRDGYDVSIYNSDVLWKPQYCTDPSWEEEVLAFVETPMDCGGDLTFEVTGLSKDIIDEVIHDCTYLQKDLGRVMEGERGSVLLDKQGELFVGGLFVCKINGHKYSYNFHPKYLPLNRDRKTIDTWDLARNTGLLLAEVFPAKEVATLIESRSADVNYAQYHHSSKSAEIKDECYKNFSDKYGEDVVAARDQDDKIAKEKMGLKNVVVVGSETHYSYLVDSRLYGLKYAELTEGLEEPEEDTRSPLEILEVWWSGFGSVPSSHDMEDFSEILNIFKERGVKWGQ